MSTISKTKNCILPMIYSILFNKGYFKKMQKADTGTNVIHTAFAYLFTLVQHLISLA